MSSANHRVLPGFHLSLSFAITYLTLLVLIPLGACFARASTLFVEEPPQPRAVEAESDEGPEQVARQAPASEPAPRVFSFRRFLKAVWTPRAQAAYALTFGASFIAAVFDTLIGLLLAWVLVRYEFPFKRIFDSLIDLPFALPTAVAGLVYSSLFVQKGWYGRYLVPLGIQGAHSRLGIVLVLAFVGLPFVVRALQPVLENLEPELEEAAACLGATRLQTFFRVIMPSLVPALMTGFALTLARGLGEYGSIVFISSNQAFKTEIAPMLIVAHLDEYHYAEATGVACVLLVISFAMLAVINALEHRTQTA